MYVPDKIQENETLMLLIMMLLNYLRFSFIFITLFLSVIFISCIKEEDQPSDTGAIKIISITATDTILKAWVDTANITVVATGDNLNYEWQCNHGTLHGSGSQVQYMAGECCVGLNTVTCRVYNDTSSVSRDINIRITSYFEN